MMQSIDIRTFRLVFTIISLVIVVIFGAATGNLHKRSRATGLWAAGFLLQTAGYFLIFLRGLVPDLFSMSLANTLVVAGHVMLGWGIDAYAEQPLRLRLGLVWTAVSLAAILLVSYAQDSLNLRVFTVSVLLGGIDTIIAIRLVRLRNSDVRRQHLMTAGFLFASAAAMGASCVLSLVEPPLQSLFVYSPTSVIAFCEAFVMTIFVAFGLLSMLARTTQVQWRDSKRMLRLVLDSIPQSLFWKDNKSTYLGCNRVFAEWAGLSGPDDVVGMTDGDMPWAAEAGQMQEIDRQIVSSGSPRTGYVQSMVTTRGKDRKIRMSKFPLRDAQESVLGVLGTSEDITEWVNSEAERVLLGTAIEKAVESVVITDQTGAIQYVNPVFLNNYGYAREEVLGRNPRILKSGRQDEEFYRDLWATVGSGKVWQGRLFNLRKDRSLLIEEAIISPVLDPNGTASHFVKVARDVTYEVDLEKRFQQAQKMQAVGRLAGGVAHDFNNILTVISGYSELLARTLGKDGAWNEALEAIIDAAARATTLTGQLLTFSRKQLLEPQVIDLNEVVRGIEQMLRRLIGEDIVLCTELETSLGNVFVDKVQIEQVILNLSVNARDAMPQGGRLLLQTRHVQRDEALCPAPYGVRPGEYAVLKVTDTGTGMTEDVKAHLFEPFFTTKPEQKGTGLGLATVYGIVAQSGGFVEVASRLGEGTQFQIFFPITRQQKTSRPKSGPAVSIAGGNERILFVEDDPAIRKLLKRSLQESGFTVIEAPGASQALEIFRARPGSFQLLLTDVIMPGSSGPELADVLCREQPGMKVLFISGYTADETTKYGVLGSEINLLQKPFSMRQLARRVRETLDRG
jgi:PAS domain S-box-containing protein